MTCDPFDTPFACDDPDRASIRRMLVPRDIDAFVAAEWSAVVDDFIADDFVALDFTAIGGYFQLRS